VGFVTSPTADKGSIDAISTTVAQEQKAPVLYTTAKDYVEYIKPENFPDTIDKNTFNNSPKYVFPTGSEYSKATAEASNSLLVTGGRDATVSDFVNAVNKGNKVVIMDNKALGGTDWNEKKNRPNNGASYIKEQIEAFKEGKPLPYPDCKGFNQEFLQKNSDKLDDLVKVVTVSNENDIPGAVKAAASHLKGEIDPKASLVNLDKASDIKGKADEVFKNTPFRIATAGYSAPPEGYEGLTTKLLSELPEALGKNNVGFVTSPTADKGSIDAITTTVGQKQNTPLLYTTAQDYVEYIKPENFPDTIDKAKYGEAPKYVLPNGSEYSKATAEASNSLLVTGGRDATVNDFVNAVEHGNKVVVVDNPNLGGVGWQEKKNRPNNGAAYIKEQIEAFKDGKPLPYPDCKGFNMEFLQKNSDKLDNLLKVVTLSNEGDVPGVANQVSRHLKGE
jgi:hypothetical protein